MVMTSDQISAMAGNFQAQTMGQMQHAAMISQQIGGGQSTGEAMMGRAVNMGSAIGAPVAMGGMALAGLDPFSMALRGGMMGSRLGAAGMIGGGLMGAGAIGAPLMAAQYAGGQMLTGMQQQQQLDSTLRQTYQFAGPSGRGFSSGQSGQIGEMLRSMSGTQGPGGEFATMGELTRMAGMMGQMGMGRGVQNVKDFTEKFRTMMKEVKEVAQAFHTSLEEAQQVVGQMRSSGIFRNQGQVAQQIRSTALGGGLATSEVTSAMNIGSQISRSIGGRGRAGAMGGMQTIGQIGLAQQTGIMSEEDIYNVTGLTGAEGRQAMAQQMMGQSAQFLRGGLGRRFLASIAGKGGTLDEASVAEYMYGGGVGTGQTMSMAHRNLAKVGRADFIRNEGRLRGAAFEKFGGLAPAMVMKGWLEQRGLDTDSDRAMIFAQRRLGMGTDEAEQMMKMVRNLPQLMRQQEMATHRDDRLERIGQMRSRTGIEGVKRKFERARNDLNNTLQQMGADFYKEGANAIERWANKLTGNFAIEMSEGIEPAIQEVLRGGSGAEAVLAERFGVHLGGQKGLLGANRMDRARRGAFGGERMGALQAATQAGDVDRMRRSGYGITAGSDAEYIQQTGAIRGIQNAFLEGNSAVGGLGTGASAEIKEQLLMRGGLRKGMMGQTDFGRMLDRSQDPRLQKLSMQYGQASSKERAAIMGTVLRDAGLGELGESSAIASPQRAVFGMGGFRTIEDRNRALGDYTYGAAGLPGGSAQRDELERKGGMLGTAARVLAAGPTGGLTELFGFGEDIQRRVKGSYAEKAGAMSENVRAASATYMMSEEGQTRLRGLLSRDEGMRSDAIKASYDEMATLRARQNKLADQGGKLSEAEQGRLAGLQTGIITSEFHRLADEIGEDEAAKQLAERFGRTPDDIRSQAMGGAAAVGQDAANAYKEMVQRAQEHGQERSDMFRRAGFLEGGRLSAKAIGTFGAIGKKQVLKGSEGGYTGQLRKMVGASRQGTFGITTGQRAAAGLMISAQSLSAMNAMDPNDPRNKIMLEQHLEASRDVAATFGDQSDDELRKEAEAYRKAGDVQTAASLTQRVGMRRKLARAGGGQRGMILAAESLGTSISRKDLMKMKDPDAMAQALGQELAGSKFSTDTEKGGQGAVMYEDLREALRLQKEGKTKEAANKMAEIQQSHGNLMASAQKEKQEKAAEDSDPSYRRLGELKTAIEGMGKKLDGTLKVAVQGEVKTISKGDAPEDPKGGQQ